MRVVVTGGAGFIGSHVADAFVERGDEVLVVDDFSSGSRDYVPDRANLAELDIADADRVQEAFAGFGPEYVCHLAAQASVTVSVKEPKRDFDSNVLGTFNILNSATEHRARTVFASTGGALYGEGAPIPTDESYVAQPLSPYGASKQAAEAFVGALARFHGIDHAVLRLGNVYGPRQSPHGEAGVVAIFSERLLLDGRSLRTATARRRATTSTSETSRARSSRSPTPPQPGRSTSAGAGRCPFSTCWTASSRQPGRRSSRSSSRFGQAS